MKIQGSSREMPDRYRLLLRLVCQLLLMMVVSQRSVASPREAVQKLVEESGAHVGVAYRSLDGVQELFIEPDRPFHAASTMKVPVMIELFEQVKHGGLSLEDTLLVRNEFQSIVDGSPYQLFASDDSDTEIYGAIGRSRTLLQLCNSMITISSNLATNLLIEKLGVENIRKTVDRLGGQGMEVLRGLEDGKAYRAGMNNRTNARGFFQLLWTIAQLEAVDRESSLQMIEILKNQQWNEAIPSGLPEGLEVAHKTGQITRIHHDGGIVYGARPFVLVVLVEGIEDGRKSARLIGEITRQVYEWSLQGTEQP